jgi:hypothetical protein
LSAAEHTQDLTNYPKRAAIEFVPGTLLNTNCTIPTSMLNGQHVEVDFYLEDPRQVIASNSQTAGYVLSNIYLDCTYLFSPSLEQGVQSVTVDVDDFGMRYISLGQLRNIIRLNSSYSNLSSVQLHVKDASTIPNQFNTTFDKIESDIGWSDIESVQVYANQRPLFPEILSGDTTQYELYESAKSVHPIEESVFYPNYKGTVARTKNQPPILVSFDSAPKFSEELQSGLHSARFGGDAGLYVDVTFRTGTTALATLECVAFLKHTSRITLANGNLVREF